MDMSVEDPFADNPQDDFDYGEHKLQEQNILAPYTFSNQVEAFDDFQNSSQRTRTSEESESVTEFGSEASEPFAAFEHESSYGTDSDYESELDSIDENYSFADQRRPRLTRLQMTWHFSYRECCNQFDMSARDWNEEFQYLYEMAELRAYDLASKRRLQNLFNDFDELTRGLIKKIVDKGFADTATFPDTVSLSTGIGGTGIFPTKDIGLVPLCPPQTSNGNQGKHSDRPEVKLEDIKTVSQLRKWRKERGVAHGEHRKKNRIADDVRGSRSKQFDDSHKVVDSLMEMRDPLVHRCFRAGNIFLQKWITDSEVMCARGVQASFRSLLVSRVHGICFPLCALHTYRGVTFTSIALIPLGRNAKLVHKSDLSPDTPLFASAHQIVKSMAQSVNILPYDIGYKQLKVAGVEVFEAPDTRLYCINAFGLLPPLFVEAGSSPRRRLEHVVRSPTPAAFMHSPGHAYEKSCEQVAKLLPKIVKNILFNPEGCSQVLASHVALEQAEALETGRGVGQALPTGTPSQRVLFAFVQSQLVKLLHSHGVNICLLGEVLRCVICNEDTQEDVGEATVTALCIEMIARTAKRFFYRELHRMVVFSPLVGTRAKYESVVGPPGYGNDVLLHVLSRLIGALFPKSGATANSSSRFVDSFLLEMSQKFGFELDQDERMVHEVLGCLTCPLSRSRIIRRVCEMCGISLASGSVQRVSNLSSRNNYSTSYAQLWRSESVAQVLDTSKDIFYSSEYLMSCVLPNRIRVNCQNGDFSVALRDAQKILSALFKFAHSSYSAELDKRSSSEIKYSVTFNSYDITVMHWVLVIAWISGTQMRRYDDAMALLDDAFDALPMLTKRSEEIAMATASDIKIRGNASLVKSNYFSRVAILMRVIQGTLIHGKGELQKAKLLFADGLKIAREKLPKESHIFASALILLGLQGLLDIAQTPIGAMVVDVKNLRDGTITPFLAKMRASPYTHKLLEQLGSALLHAGEILPAAECLGQAAEQSRGIFGADSQEFATDLNLWAFALMRSDINRFGSRCELLMTQAMLIIEKISGPFSVNHLTAINNLGALQIALKKFVRASKLLHEAHSACVKNSGRFASEVAIRMYRTTFQFWDSIVPDIRSKESARKSLVPLLGGVRGEAVGVDHPVAHQILENIGLLRQSFQTDAAVLVQQAWRHWKMRNISKSLLNKAACAVQRVGRAFIRREALKATLSIRELYPLCFGLSCGLLEASSEFVTKNQKMGRDWNSDLQQLVEKFGAYSPYAFDGYKAKLLGIEKINQEFLVAAADAINSIERHRLNESRTVCHQNIVLTNFGSDTTAEHYACLIVHLNRVILCCDVPFISVPFTVAHKSSQTGSIYLCQSVIPLGKTINCTIRENNHDTSRALLGLPAIDYIASRRKGSLQYMPFDPVPANSDLVLAALKHLFLFLNCGLDLMKVRVGEMGLNLERKEDTGHLHLCGPRSEEPLFLKCVGALEVVEGTDGRFYLTNPLGLKPQWWASYGDNSGGLLMGFRSFRSDYKPSLGINIPRHYASSERNSMSITESLDMTPIWRQGIVSSVRCFDESFGKCLLTPFSFISYQCRKGDLVSAQQVCEEWLKHIPEVCSNGEINAEYLMIRGLVGELHLERNSLEEGVKILRPIIVALMKKKSTTLSGVRYLDYVGKACLRGKQTEGARQIYTDCFLTCEYLRLMAHPVHTAELILIPLVGMLRCAESDGKSFFSRTDLGGTDVVVDSVDSLSRGFNLTSRKLFVLTQMIRTKSWLTARVVAIFHEFSKFLLKQKHYDVAAGISSETCKAACEVHGHDSLQHVRALTTESQIYFSWDPKIFSKECREPLEIAISILEKIAPQSQQLGSIRNNLGFLLMQQRNYFAAKVQYTAAEEVLRKCLEGSTANSGSMNEIAKIRRNMAVVNNRITLECVIKIQAIARGWFVRKRKDHFMRQRIAASYAEVEENKLRKEQYRLLSLEQRDRMLVLAQLEMEYNKLKAREKNDRLHLVASIREKLLMSKSSRWIGIILKNCVHVRERWWLLAVDEPVGRIQTQCEERIAFTAILINRLINIERVERDRVLYEEHRSVATGLFLARSFSEAAVAVSTLLICQALAVQKSLGSKLLRGYIKCSEIQEGLNRSHLENISLEALRSLYLKAPQSTPDVTAVYSQRKLLLFENEKIQRLQIENARIREIDRFQLALLIVREESTRSQLEARLLSILKALVPSGTSTTKFVPPITPPSGQYVRKLASGTQHLQREIQTEDPRISHFESLPLTQ